MACLVGRRSIWVWDLYLCIAMALGAPQDGISGASAHFALAGCLNWNSAQSNEDRSFGVHLVPKKGSLGNASFWGP
jgi:hypothetical protein